MEKSLVKTRQQQTLAEAISYSGIGIHTGEVVTIRLCPADAGTGIVFKRVDLPSMPIVPATLEYVCATRRSTTLGVADVQIHTVEHLLAALRAYQVDNLVIEINSIEPPVCHGSSDTFVQLIEEVGVVAQDKERPTLTLKHSVYWSEGDIHVVAHPYDGYRISYTLHYPESQALDCQFYSYLLGRESFKDEIAPCRTFSQYEEVSALMDRGLIKGGSLDNAVIIKGDAVFSKGGLFFPNEMVRHKILDMIGDLSLIGYDFDAHIIAIRSGHSSNVSFAKEMYQHFTMEESQ